MGPDMSMPHWVLPDVQVTVWLVALEGAIVLVIWVVFPITKLRVAGETLRPVTVQVAWPVAAILIAPSMIVLRKGPGLVHVPLLLLL